MNRISLSRVATALVATALPFVAFAQTNSTATPLPPVPNAMVSSSSTAPALPRPLSEKVEQHIKQLHDQLAITAAEEPQWKQFAQVMRDNADRMQQAFTMRGTNVADMSAVGDMQSYAQLTQLHATNMQALSGAFQTLYNTFPDPQKKIADGVFRNHDRRPALTKN